MRKLEVIEPQRRTPSRLAPVLVGVALIGLAGLATLRGADSVRREFDAADLADGILRDALAVGNTEPSVRAGLLDLRSAVTRRPLDSKTRVAYASLLLGLSRRLDDLEVPAFHARRSAALAPVTLPVVRTAALVLTNTGHTDESLTLTRSVFEYDADAAAELLAWIEVQVPDAAAKGGLLDTAEAWLAWSKRLDSAGRSDEAADWLASTTERWPDHPGSLERRGVLAVRQGDWETLRELFPPERSFPEEREYAQATVCRALLRAHDGDDAAARADVELALRLDRESFPVQIHAGNAYEAIGDARKSRDQWNRALFSLPRTDSSRPRRTHVLGLLARWEDQHGEPAAALRLWESVLELNPAHREARRRVDDLSGFRR